MIEMLDYDSFKYDEVVTHHVSVWICNDGDLIDFARQVALGGPKALKRYVTAVLRLASRNTSKDWHPHHHILQADTQFRDVVFDYIPYVNAKDCKRLLEIGFQKNVHFRLVDEHEDHLPIG
jgi:hypothetical protein